MMLDDIAMQTLALQRGFIRYPDSVMNAVIREAAQGGDRDAIPLLEREILSEMEARDGDVTARRPVF